LGLDNDINYFTIFEILMDKINSDFLKNLKIIIIFINSSLNYYDINDDLHEFNFNHKSINYFVDD